jgi:4-amino-4-deoxy-L-arabinose transferase-like glycosyltransferase
MPGAVLNRILLVLLGLAALVYVVDLGGSSIWDANEAFYAETPREMVERADYVNPTFNYEARINKPVLSYWVVAGLYRVAGESVGVERAAIAAAALLMIGAAFLIGRAASTHRASPLLAALGLAANPRFFMFGRRILVDVLLAAFMTLTLALFALAERHPERRRSLLLLMYVCVGLGLLTKGPVAAALPAIVFFLYLAYHRELGRIRTMMLPLGAVIVAAIVSPWYIALYRQNGWAPIRSFVVGENFERFTSQLGVSRGPLFYIPVMFSDALPWSLLLPVAIWAWWRGRRDATADATSRVRTLLIFWIIAIVGFFSLSSTKQDLYILPIIAAVAALGADVLARNAIDSGGSLLGAVRWSLLITGIVLAIAGAGVFYVFEKAGSAYAVDGTVTLSAIGVAGGLATAILAGRHRSGWAALVIAAALIGVNWTLVLRALPSFERYKPVVPMSDTLRGLLKPDDVVMHWDVALPSMVFYLQRRIETAYSPEQFVQTAREHARVFGVMPEDRFEQIKNDLGPSACVVERRATFDARLREMLARRPPTAIVLINTRCTPSGR